MHFCLDKLNTGSTYWIYTIIDHVPDLYYWADGNLGSQIKDPHIAVTPAKRLSSHLYTQG